MSDALLTLAHASLQASLLIAVLVVVRRWLGDRLPPSIYCAGWTLAALRLVVPWSVHTRVGLTAAGTAGRWGITELRTDLRGASPPFALFEGGPLFSGPDASVVLASLWVAGVVVVAAILILRIVTADRRLRDATPTVDPELQRAWIRLHEHAAPRRIPPVVVSEHVSTPTVTGLLRPRIVVPASVLGRLDAHEWEPVLLHELAHVRRLDLPLAAVWAVAVALHWPNPLAWWGATLFRRDRELAADAFAVRRLAGDRTRVGRALLRVVELAGLPRATATTAVSAAALGAASELRRRVLAIANDRPRRGVHALAVAALALIALVTLSDPMWISSTVRNGDLEDGASSQWFMSGYQRDEYRAEVDAATVHGGRHSARLQPRSRGFGRYATLMQHLSAEPFRGHQIRVTAFVRGEAIDGRGDFWARIQAEDSPPDGPGLGADACQLTGSFDWRRCELLLDVPEAGAYLQFGVGLGANGTVWLDDTSVELLAG